MKNIVIYTRVSTNTQEVDRQVNELSDFALKQNYKVTKIFSEKVSGNKRNDERKELIEMIDYCLNHQIEKVYVSSLDRLGRNTLEVLKAVEELNNNRISLFIFNLGIETLTSSKEINPTTKIMITMLAEFASMERTQIRQRMASGYQNYLANNGKVGRKKGQIKSNEALKNEHKDIIKYLRQGQSIRNTAKLTGKSTPTVQKIKKYLLNDKNIKP